MADNDLIHPVYRQLTGPPVQASKAPIGTLERDRQHSAGQQSKQHSKAQEQSSKRPKSDHQVDLFV